jgi:hypothetical protein
MASQNLDSVRRSISVTLEEIESLTKALAAKGIDARDPDDIEAFEIVSRIEREALAKKNVK